MAFFAGAMFTACGSADDEPNDTSKPGDDNYPPITIEEMISGKIKAGFPGAISIQGDSFDASQDFIFIGYMDGDKQVLDRVSSEVLEMKATRISFGVRIDYPNLDKKITIYLDRPGYTLMPITGEITFEMPTVAEGYIPDPGFRGSLMSTHDKEGNAEIAAMFDSYGLIDPVKAATVESINLYNSQAASLEGIELFTGVTRLIGNDMQNLVKADFSKWTAKGVFANFERSLKLEEVITGPYFYRFDGYQCPKLKKVDMHLSKWIYNVQIFYDDSPTTYSYITYLDIRRQRTGTLKEGDATGEYPKNVETDYSILMDGVWMKVAADCHILVDYQFLIDKKMGGSDTNRSGYGTIYSAWTRGATIDVYASKDITKKIGTVPMHKDDAGALTLTGANGWTVEDK